MEELNKIVQKLRFDIFLRVTNILHNIKNNINPIYIEDFMDTMEFIEKEYK